MERKKYSCKDCKNYSEQNYTCGPFGNQAKFDNCDKFGKLFNINKDCIDCFYFEKGDNNE